MKKLLKKGKTLALSVMQRQTAVKSGEGYLDVLIKILITVIIGAALLALLRTTIPELFNDIVDKIKSVFTI